MEKTRFITFIAAVLLLVNLLLVATVFFRNDSHRAPVRPEEIIEQRLHFTPSQMDEFEHLRESHHRTVVQCRDSIRQLKRSLFKLITAPSVNDVEQARIIDHIGAYQQRIEKATVGHFRALRGICTDEQKQLFDELVEEMAMALDRPGPPARHP